jgi:septal ring factor EnvC (AmiA/AmiB activator)
VTAVGEMKSRPGFRSRKGTCRCRCSTNWSRWVRQDRQPRFNTVTVQKGIDIRASLGTEIVSVAPGTVVFAGWLKGYGNLVIVDHGDAYHSLYAHLDRLDVEVGMVVEQEEAIGLVGDTGSLKGAYLYFEIRKGGQAIDPLPWLEAE